MTEQGSGNGQFFSGTKSGVEVEVEARFRSKDRSKSSTKQVTTQGAGRSAKQYHGLDPMAPPSRERRLIPAFLKHDKRRARSRTHQVILVSFKARTANGRYFFVDVKRSHYNFYTD